MQEKRKYYRQMRVLVLERDGDISIKFMKTFLAKYKNDEVRMGLAPTIEIARDLFEHFYFEAVIMDADVGDCRDFFLEIREKSPESMCIFLSRFTHPEYPDYLKISESDYFFRKPISADNYRRMEEIIAEALIKYTDKVKFWEDIFASEPGRR